MVGIGIDLVDLAVLDGGVAVSYDADAQSLFDRMSPTPDATRKGHINTLIVALKAAGTWTLTDVLYVLAADVSANALLEWKGNTAYNAIANGAAAFVADRGYTGTSAGDYLGTAYAPGTTSLGMTNTDCHMGCYVTTGTAGTGVDMGHSTSWRNVASNTVTRASLAGTGFITGPVGNGPHHVSASRTSSTSAFCYRNGSAGLEYVISSTTALSTTELTLLANFAAATPSGRQVAIAHQGRAWTAQQTLDSYTAFAAYLTAIGAPA